MSKVLLAVGDMPQHEFDSPAATPGSSRPQVLFFPLLLPPAAIVGG